MSQKSLDIAGLLSGKHKEASIENKIFNVVSLLAAFTCFSSFVINLFVGFPIIFNILLLVCGTVFSLFYYLSYFRKITRVLEIPLQFIAISLLTFVWFFNQGIEGSGTFYFFLITYAFIYSNSRKKYWTILLLHLLVVTILVIINYFYPQYIMQYPGKEAQILDLSASMIISLAILGVTAIILKKNYDKERMKVEQHADQLKILNTTKDKLFSIISHDLRNPFNNLLGMSRQLTSNIDEYSKADIKERVQLIEESSKRGYELLENLLQWSLSQSGEIKFKPAAINVSAIVKECWSILENQASAKKIEFVSNINEELIVNADHNMLKVILRNLLTNAIKYSFPNGKVTINAVKIRGNKLMISVADEGMGIPENEIQMLFRTDATYSSAGTANETGTGLGLILCKEFVEKHKGEIWVESILNSGSTFNFTLPL